jgi:signal transduction histidine kinase/ActR/RegA family two-component response regulator
LHLIGGRSTTAAPGARQEATQATAILESDERIVQSLKALGFKACSCHPLLAEYELLGTLCFASRVKDRFADDEIDFLRSVSHYATAAYERLRRIGQLREMDRRKDEFLATLAHELRNPLAPLRNMLELIKRANGDPAVIEQAEVTMSRQLQQLEQLVDDLLDVNRITRGKLQLRKRRVELAPLLHQATEPAKPLAERARQELTVSAPSEPMWVRADPVRLVQIFGNLLTNACKYTDDGGHIQIIAERVDGEAVVTVKDDGIGIPPDQLRAVFEMFSQVKSGQERAEGGLGIGLTLVKRLVEMHDGYVEAHSEGLGRGSEFIVRLPVLDAPHAERPAATAAHAAPTRRKILIVDDNRDSAMSLALLLGQLGHETRQAYDGLDAIRAAEEFRPNLILLDIGLPHLNGYDVCRRIRTQPWGDMMIVALTGWGQDEDRQKSREAGFDHHLVKPIGYAALMQLLSEPKQTKAPAAASARSTSAQSADGEGT